MLNKLTKYPSYKDSGLGWLGEIPEHWELSKGKWEWRKENRPVRKDDGIVTAFRDGQVTLRSNRREDGFTMANLEHGYQGIRKGDLVIHGMDAFAGAIGVSDSDGKSTPVYSACTPKKGSNPYFFAYLLKEMSRTGWIESLAKGIRERSTEFKYPQFSVLDYPIPPLPEQTAIANFLDKKTAEIKEFIALKEKTIELLKERKMAIINQAVTKGLDPTVEMKDSGIEWLGEIPKHWEFTKISSVSKKVSRKGIKNPVLLSVEREKGVILRTDSEGNHNIIPEDLSSYKLVEPGNLVLNKMKTWQGSLGISSYTGVVSPAYIILEINASFEIKYLHHLLRCKSYVNEYNRISYGVRPDQWDMHFEDFKQLPILLPTVAEQQLIIHHIEQKIEEIEISILEIIKEIELIKEYQQSLISEVVTGKVDVSSFTL